MTDDTVRIDKWLWAARFYKTRSAKSLQPGDRLHINIRGYEWEIEVLALAAQRGPAVVARTLYSEGEESTQKRALEVEKRRRVNEPASTIKGRPTKRDRRALDDFNDPD
jgi:ribosome-associated heat shock protein Hsp15